eukprot:CAMPEP_0170319868 /NCGR_PEP_ID=MMETSP0116_2-20130129/60653_1 /TAXON_ID=400756 /ORGANISM="Durinskia baltica, Strain CSIRO CS-38" /LENGTH=31 /DNA_ID= /DNA_START= /DNA_END= /DNA_ORIENTATION=
MVATTACGWHGGGRFVSAWGRDAINWRALPG